MISGPDTPEVIQNEDSKIAIQNLIRTNLSYNINVFNISPAHRVVKPQNTCSDERDIIFKLDI